MDGSDNKELYFKDAESLTKAPDFVQSKDAPEGLFESNNMKPKPPEKSELKKWLPKNIFGDKDFKKPVEEETLPPIPAPQPEQPNAGGAAATFPEKQTNEPEIVNAVSSSALRTAVGNRVS